jgi:kynurenine 3-monooxygenase
MKCYPWTYEDKVALIGDASHYSSLLWTRNEFCFEDISILNEMIEKYGDDWKTIFSEYKIS